jgi:B12-binding domain/radical SAM domain protein
VDVLHHRGSPSRLIREAHIPPVFDVVVSGDGEYVIAELGEIVAHVAPPYHPQKIVGKLSTNTPGDWIVSLPEDCVEIVSAGHRIDPNGLPPLPGLFGVSASFDVFNGRMTAHVFSDIGRGCVYNCDFCSEKSSVTGPLNALPSAAKRLYRQLEDAVEIIQEDYPTLGASAFVEDSVLLGGSPKALDSLASMLEQQPLQIEFGAQLTIDQVLARGPQLARLAQVGLRYLFIGVETMDPNDFGGMSKDIGGKGGSWDSRTRHAFDLLQHHGIACGCSLLFGLGERHSSRVALLEMLINNRRKSGYPSVLSANWAVQHPLRGTCGDPGYNYVDWGTPIGPYIELFHHFGEASLLYPLSGQRAPAIHEIEEVVAKLTEFNTCICVPRSKHGSTIVDLSTTL